MSSSSKRKARAASPHEGGRASRPLNDDTPTQERVAPLLTTRALARRVVHLERCGSTNDVAAAEARAGAPHGTVVVADAQEAGRGRLGRTWFSPPGENLYASFVLRPDLPPQAAPPLTLAAGVAVAETIDRVAGVRIALKWPNDVLAASSRRKLAGILTELASGAGGGADRSRVEFVVIGIGVNVRTRIFPPELGQRATSLAIEGAAELRRPALLAGLAERLEHWIDRYSAEGTAAVARAWRAIGDPAGQRMKVAAGNQTIEGVARGVDDEGALLLDTDGGKHYRILSGEVLA